METRIKRTRSSSEDLSETNGILKTYHGLVDTVFDAVLLFEACRLGVLPMANKRLSDTERSLLIKSGAIFIWDEQVSNMKRWTDGIQWSPSRVSGAFLLYRQMQARRRSTDYSQIIESSIKSGGLVKKTISISTGSNTKRHLVSYYNPNDSTLKFPSMDERLKQLKIDPEMYPILQEPDNASVAPSRPEVHSPQVANIPENTQLAPKKTLPPLRRRPKQSPFGQIEWSEMQPDSISFVCHSNWTPKFKEF